MYKHVVATKSTMLAVFAGAILISCVAIAKPDWFGMMPRRTTLADKTNLNGKWVDSHKRYFVDSENNEQWFNWVFANRYQVDKENKKSKFASIQKGGKNSEENSLAKACKEAYEVGPDKVKSQASEITSSNNNDHFLEDDIWRYCSLRGKKVTPTKRRR